jgi:hypothetical protein
MGVNIQTKIKDIKLEYKALCDAGKKSEGMELIPKVKA